MSKATSAGFLSVDPEDATEGGGIDGALADVTELEYVGEFRYQNGQKGGAAVRAKYTIEGFDKPWERHYSIGAADKYEVLEDGDSIKPLGKNRGLNKKSNAFLFFSSLKAAVVEAGLDFAELIPEGNIAPLREFFEAGNRVRLTNVKSTDIDGKQNDLPVIGTIEAGGKAGKKNGKVSAKAAESDDDDLKDKTVSAIEKIVDDAEAPVKFADLPGLIYDSHKKDPEVRAMRQWASSEKNVADDGLPWNWNSKKRTLASK